MLDQKRCKVISFVILIDPDRKMSGSSHWRVSTHCCRWWLESVRKSGSASSTLTRRPFKVIPVPDYGSTSRSRTNAVPVSTLIQIYSTCRCTYTYVRTDACANVREQTRDRAALSWEQGGIVFLRDIRFLFRRTSSVRSVRRSHKSRRYRRNSSHDTHDGSAEDSRGKFSGATWSGRLRSIPVAAGIFTAGKNVILQSFRDPVRIQVKSKLRYE